MAKTFVEIGTANFDTLLPLAKQGWSGLAVEPVPYLADQAKNIYSETNIHVMECAISDVSGKLDMAVARDDGSWLTGCSHIVSPNHMGYKLSSNPDRQGDFDEIIQVDCITLDELLVNMQTLDFLKVDAEGHELNIFKNYSFRVKPRLVKIEHKHVDDTVLAKRLEENGYLVWTEKDDIYGVI